MQTDALHCIWTRMVRRLDGLDPILIEKVQHLLRCLFNIHGHMQGNTMYRAIRLILIRHCTGLHAMYRAIRLILIRHCESQWA